MLVTPIMDVAIGLIFFYVLLSLVCSSIQEIIASIFGLRSKNLEKGIKNLIGSEYTRSVYKHPLIKGLRKPGKLPSYIRPEIFTAALLEVVAKDKAGKSVSELTACQLRDAINEMERANPARDLLLSLAKTDEDTVDGIKQRLAGWFGDGMDRVSGWYKRQVKYFLLAIAMVVTVALNADSIHIAEQLWKNDALRTMIAAEADKAGSNEDTIVINAEVEIETFPIGYPGGFPKITFQMIVGWIMTIMAISLGAPFWFDLLSRISHLRATGAREANRAKGK